MNVTELYFLAEWLRKNGAPAADHYQTLQQALEHNANQPQKQPLEEPLNRLLDYLKNMNMNQLSNGQIDYLSMFDVIALFGKQGLDFVNSTIRKSDFDPATASSEMREAHQRIERAVQKASQILEVFSDVLFTDDRELHEEGRVTVRIEFVGSAEIQNVADWKSWSATWHDIVRGVGLAVNEAPEDTKVIGASQGSVIMILASTYAFTRILALISKSIASIAKDYLEVRMAAEKLQAIKGFKAESKKQLLKNAEEIQKNGVDQVIADIKSAIDHELDGTAEAGLRRSIEKALDFHEKGGEVDFVSPSTEQANADQQGEDGIPEEIIAEVRQVIEDARQARQEVKLPNFPNRQRRG